MANDFNYTTDDILNMLTVAMHVDHADDDSNWVKYFKVWSDTFADVQNKNDAIRQANSLDSCSGSMLDDEARNVGISRNGVDDDFLRFEIKSRLLARVCDGSMPSLYKLISNSLGCSPKEFAIQPMYEIDGTPNAIQINDIPETYLANSRQAELLRDVIQDAVADGIRVLSITYQTYIKSKFYYVVGTSKFEHEYNTLNKQRSLDYFENSIIYSYSLAQVEHEYWIRNKQRSLDYFVETSKYASPVYQIEHEYNIQDKYRDLVYPINGNSYLSGTYQIEHEYTVQNKKRS